MSEARQEQWTKERVELIKRTVCPQGITEDELALFMEQCKRSGLDPLQKQAFCVPRRNNVGTRDNPRWVEKREFQPSEAGMLARAEEFPDYLGCTAGAVYSEDSCEVDQGAGVVAHKFSPTKKRGALLGAWGRVERKEKATIVVWLELGGYQQRNGMWDRIPANMLEKCARVAALRKAYPAAFGGLYIQEEPQDEGDDEPRAVAVAKGVQAPPSAPALGATAATTTVTAEPPLDEQQEIAALEAIGAAATPAELGVLAPRFAKLPEGAIRARVKAAYTARLSELKGAKP
jgi:phage recombination protein Bet